MDVYICTCINECIHARAHEMYYKYIYETMKKKFTLH